MDKSARAFDFALVHRAALFALEYLARNSQRQRLSSFMPNSGVALCNKHPKQSESQLYQRTIPKVHLLMEDTSTLLTIVELKLENGLYDQLALVRDETGVFAYRAQMMFNLRELTQFLAQESNPESKSEEASSSSASAVDGTRPTAAPMDLVMDRATTNVNLTADEQHVSSGGV
jgi:hypothetical protein